MMTDYSQYTDEQLAEMQQDISAKRDDLLTQGMQISAQRDDLLSQGNDIQAEIDRRKTQEDVEQAVAEMSDEEKAAMQQALNG